MVGAVRLCKGRISIDGVVPQPQTVQSYLKFRGCPEKGNITHAAILMKKLNPYYGDRFKDKLCFSDLNEAVSGYARGGFIDEVNDLIKRGADFDFVVSGYASGGHVNKRLKQSASRDAAIEGYKNSGYIDLIQQFM